VSVRVARGPGARPGTEGCGDATQVSIAEACMYTNTPDHDFILDTLPGCPNIVVGAACSGHGFKMGPLVGKILADVATTGACTTVDMQPFRLARF
jgi:glycine/D-amino acid oxidase-like deaminating enzyme